MKTRFEVFNGAPLGPGNPGNSGGKPGRSGRTHRGEMNLFRSFHACGCVLVWSVVACSSDEPCPPCPQPLAAMISVTAPNAPTGIVGLTMTLTGALVGGGPCSQPGSGPTVVCEIRGGPGDYQ